MPTKTTTKTKKSTPKKSTAKKSTRPTPKKSTAKKPAPARQATRDTPSTYNADLAHIATLKPGQFRKVREFSTETGAKDALFKIRHGREGVEVPPGKWEFDARRDVTTGTSVLMVRYTPLEGSAVEVWWRRFGKWIDHVDPAEAAAKSRRGKS